MLKTIRK